MKKIMIIAFCILVVISSIIVVKANFLKPKDFTLTRMCIAVQTDKDIVIYHSLPDGKTLLMKMSQKPWGAWNIEGWYVTDEEKVPAIKADQIAGGGSEWEYVFRAGLKKTLGVPFTGGNHGREQLRSIKLYDEESGNEIELKRGNKAHVKSLKIIEETTISLDDQFQKKYADVQRTYLILPSKITLTSDFKFLRDIYMGTSYICMLPMKKDYGRYIKFTDTGEQFTTPMTGETKSVEGSPNYLGKEKTMSASMWGDADPNYVFHTWIENPEMTDNFSNKLKVFYWDMDKTMNKLYFSKYDYEDPKFIPAGTEWHNKQGWELQVKNQK